MRKKIIAFISVLCIIFSCVGFTGCINPKPQTENTKNHTIINGGFESADLSGWTVEYGDAFDDDCVSSKNTFMFENDANNTVWYKVVVDKVTYYVIFNEANLQIKTPAAE